jgi:hypothetical protein
MSREARAMNEAKPFASLSSTLLARKGQAKPAMRPQGFHMGHEAPFQVDPFHRPEHDDLGWNDMGHDTGPVALHPNAPVDLTPEPPAVVTQQRELAREFAPVAVPPVVQAPAPRARAGSHGKAAFTLRLDGERHLRLRLVCAVQHRSAQQIVTQALDEFLDSQPDNAALAVRTAK